ncbi:hypothetical protein [Lactiplantibacillus herbarum]|uniref:hypothetical protein n=1 Tax=Lactiplantibacillus herbarum TaxID=1670446 RepID=UPI00064F3C30|nr:hypothetical protein [Lactiplantibacillus herbarum]
MGLVIISKKRTKLMDPEGIWDYPDANSFAYRNHPERFKADCDVYDKLSDQYEEDQSNAKVDTFDIGYGGFKKFRELLAIPLGFEYYVKNDRQPWEDIWLRCNRDDSVEVAMLQDFFLHSDCDGKFDVQHIRNLFDELNKLDKVATEQVQQIDRYAEFYSFLKTSVEEHLY